MDMGIATLEIKILLESNPLKSRILVGRLGVLCFPESVSAGPHDILQSLAQGRVEGPCLGQAGQVEATRLPERNKKPNRTGRTEPNRTEPRRVRKTQAELRRTGKIFVRTEPNRLIFEKSGTETNRTEPVPSWVS